MNTQHVLFAELSPEMGTMSAGLSIIAFAFSLYTFWINYFRPFKPIFLLSEPLLHFFHYEQEHVIPGGIKKFPVWSPTLRLGLTVYNAGVCPGRLTDLRLQMRNDDLGFAFYPAYLQDSSKYDVLRVKRGKPPAGPHEVRKATEKSSWCGLLVPKDKPIQESIVFFTFINGLREVPLGKFTFTVEYFSEAKSRWVVIEEFELEIWDWIKEQFEAGDGFVLPPKRAVSTPPAPNVDRGGLILDQEIEQALVRGE